MRSLENEEETELDSETEMESGAWSDEEDSTTEIEGRALWGSRRRRRRRTYPQRRRRGTRRRDGCPSSIDGTDECCLCHDKYCRGGSCYQNDVWFVDCLRNADCGWCGWPWNWGCCLAREAAKIFFDIGKGKFCDSR